MNISLFSLSTLMPWLGIVKFTWFTCFIVLFLEYFLSIWFAIMSFNSNCFTPLEEIMCLQCTAICFAFLNSTEKAFPYFRLNVNNIFLSAHLCISYQYDHAILYIYIEQFLSSLKVRSFLAYTFVNIQNI